MIDVERGWFKSTFSQGNSHCVEVCHGPSSVSLRDSKWDLRSAGGQPRPVITLVDTEWSDWLDVLKPAGTVTGCPTLAVTEDPADASVALRSMVDDSVLQFTAAEWRAFVLGVRSGQFDRPRGLVAETVG